MLAWVFAMGLCYCLCVCLSHAGIVSKRLNESHSFSTQSLPLACTTLCCKEIWIFLGLLPKLWTYKNFAAAHLLSPSVINKQWWTWPSVVDNSQLINGDSWSHSEYSFVYSSMCDVVHLHQLTLVINMQDQRAYKNLPLSQILPTIGPLSLPDWHNGLWLLTVFSASPVLFRFRAVD